MKNNQSKNFAADMTIGLKGEYEIEIFDTKKQVVKEKIRQKNMLVDRAFGLMLEDGLGTLLITSYSNQRIFTQVTTATCHLGTGADPTTEGMTQLQSKVATIPVGTINNTSSTTGAPPYFIQRYFVRPAGSELLNISEIGVGGNSSTNYLLSRIVLSSPINILDSDELRITWRLFCILPENNTWSGTIVGGQRNGGNINWRITISSSQINCFLTSMLGNNFISSGSIQTHGMFSARSDGSCMMLGTSNEESAIDSWNIMGTQLYQGRSPDNLRTMTYDPVNKTRALEVGFEHNSPENAQIGEMVIFTRASYISSNSLFRVTFDPPLDKATGYRVFIQFRLTLARA